MSFRACPGIYKNMNYKNKTREVALVIFYDDQGNILVQDRTNKPNAIQKYGFFGGGVEQDETPEVALKREMREELGLKIENFRFWKRSEYIVKDKGPYLGLRVIKHVFLSHITSEIINSKVFEGGKVFMKLTAAVKDSGFSYDSRDLLDLLNSKIII